MDMYLKFLNLGNSKSKMRLFWTIVLLYFHPYLHICSSSSSSSLTIDLFEKWNQEHKKSYSSDQEKQYRIKVFEKNYNYITQHNSKANSSYTLSLNIFADLTHHEFKAKYLLGQPRPSISSDDNNQESSSGLESLATAKRISIGICGSNRAFQFYSEGVFTGPCCDKLDHSVLVEGYGSRNGDEYWNVKNSWGKSWGRNGYMQLAIWNWNACGINKEIAFMHQRDKKTSSSINPAASSSTPLGSTCFPVKCSGGATCCCFKRVLLICKQFACCGSDFPVCCKVNRSCCRQDTPKCDAGSKDCYNKFGNSSMAVQSKMEAFLQY